MTDALENGGCYYAVPTRTERFWRAMGFRYHHGDDPPDADLLPGWMRTDMGLSFSWADRLRLLATGRLRISSIVHFDTPSPDVCKSRTDWHILPPGEH
jgi:hypothetical protein